MKVKIWEEKKKTCCKLLSEIHIQWNMVDWNDIIHWCQVDKFDHISKILFSLCLMKIKKLFSNVGMWKVNLKSLIYWKIYYCTRSQFVNTMMLFVAMASPMFQICYLGLELITHKHLEVKCCDDVSSWIYRFIQSNSQEAHVRMSLYLTMYFIILSLDIWFSSSNVFE